MRSATSPAGWSRRQIFRAARALGLGSLAPGVPPIINARGTFTIIGGSVELPEVRAAKAAANQHYANFEELS